MTKRNLLKRIEALEEQVQSLVDHVILLQAMRRQEPGNNQFVPSTPQRPVIICAVPSQSTNTSGETKRSFFDALGHGL